MKKRHDKDPHVRMAFELLVLAWPSKSLQGGCREFAAYLRRQAEYMDTQADVLDGQIGTED